MDTICPEILCKEDGCKQHAELIVDRTVEGEIVRSRGMLITTRPVSRSCFCYYHNKERAGKFSKEWKPGSGLFNITRTANATNYTRR